MSINRLTAQDALCFSRRHLTAYYDTDFFPKPFEFGALWYKWEEVVRVLSSPGWQPFGNPIAIPWRKPRGGYRVVHQLDPVDSIVYTAAVHSVSDSIEASRQSRHKKVACSYRIKKDPYSFFVAGSGFSDYRARCEELAAQYRYVLATDISDFYNRIYLHRLENAVSIAAGDGQGKALESFLLSINNNTSQGIPVGPAASIVLSEAVLVDVDQYIVDRGMRHVRYVDDIRIFSDSKHALDVLLQEFTLYLHQNHRLGLVGEKTRIVESQVFLQEELQNQYQIEKLEILSEIEVGNPYGCESKIAPVELDEEAGATLLKALERIERHEFLDLAVARAIIRRAKANKVQELAIHLIRKSSFYRPVINDLVLYLDAVTGPDNIHRISAAIQEMLFDQSFDDKATAEWFSWYVSKHRGLVSDDEVRQILNYSDGLRYRAAAAVTLGNVSWVRTHKDKVLNLGPWDRRAVIFAAQILARDERDKWLRSLSRSGSLSLLDKWMIDWVIAGAPEVPPLVAPPVPAPVTGNDFLVDFDDDIPF